MVRGPWVDLLQPTLRLKNKDREPCESLTSTHSATTIRGVFTLWLQNLTKIWAFSPKTILGGISQPTGPQHKHCDSPTSQYAGMEILEQRTPSSVWMTATSTLHWAVACWTSCTLYSMTTTELPPWTFCWVSCSVVSFPSMEVVIIYASSIHGCRRAFKTAFLCRVTSLFFP